LLIVLIVAMLVYVDYQAERFVDERIRTDIEQGRQRIRAAEEERIRTLKLRADLVTSIPYLKPSLETDTSTIRDILLSYQQQSSLSELFIVQDRAGRVVARTDTSEAAAVPENLETGIFATASGTYHLVRVPAEAGGTLFGYVTAGAPIDDGFARSLHEISNDDIVIVGETVLGSSVSRTTLPWQSHAEWEAAVGKDAPPRTINVDNENYAAVATLLGTESGLRPLIVIMQSHDKAIAPYRRIQAGLLALGVIAAIVGIGGSAVLARNLTSPVAKLVEGTQQVAAGNFDYRLDVRANDEIGDLARSFNTMIQGLRERADMQKFVSASTVEMIQSREQKKVSAGEKVVLTIFFSDMRGFTGMTERWTPEETVKLLNACLSLQAAKVKKFRGDIDKYVGDCVVALFQGEDMELNAIRCALETHRSLDELNASNPGEAPIRVGIGIVTGEVILGSIGSEDRLDYTIIGSNVNLCSRICSQAGPGETLVADSTYARVKGLVAAQKIAPLQVKGFTDPVPVYKMG
jgi:class 3 adenylate cyclase